VKEQKLAENDGESRPHCGDSLDRFIRLFLRVGTEIEVEVD
jgi:hypothetical protein